jgi:hypothetical protein
MTLCSSDSLVGVPSPAPQPQSPSSCAAASSAGGSSAHLDVGDLEQKLRVIGLSDDAAVLADMCAKLRKGGVMSLQDLQGLSKEEVKESVQALMLSPVQHIKLFQSCIGHVILALQHPQPPHRTVPRRCDGVVYCDV